MSYHFNRQLKLSMADAEQRVVARLAEGGFGVLTEIDFQATLKKKLRVEFTPYKILGACNPHFASQALRVEPRIGAMLPSTSF